MRVFYFHKTTVILLTRKVYRTKLILAIYSYTYVPQLVVHLLDQLIYSVFVKRLNGIFLLCIIVHCLFVIVKQLQNCLLLIDALSHLIQIFVIMQVLFLLCNRMHWLYINFLIYNVTVTINQWACVFNYFYFHTSTSACWNSIIDFHKQNLKVCCSLELYMIHHLLIVMLNYSIRKQMISI